MTFTEVKQRNERRYYYRVRSVRRGKKIEKERVYLGVNLAKKDLVRLELDADKKLTGEPAVKQGGQGKKKNNKKIFGVSKDEDFSTWYTEIVKKAELGDLRYNVKGFLVFQPWSVLCMEKMYSHLEKVMQKKGHKPYWFPTVIPEDNFKKEGEHIEGFSPNVFWLEKISEEGRS